MNPASARQGQINSCPLQDLRCPRPCDIGVPVTVEGIFRKQELGLSLPTMDWGTLHGSPTWVEGP